MLAFGQETALRDLRQFSLNAEQNLASWYTSLLLALGALLAWVAGSCDTAEGQGTRRFWRLTAILLLAAAAGMETVGFPRVAIFMPEVHGRWSRCCTSPGWHWPCRCWSSWHSGACR